MARPSPPSHWSPFLLIVLAAGLAHPASGQGPPALAWGAFAAGGLSAGGEIVFEATGSWLRCASAYTVRV